MKKNSLKQRSLRKSSLGWEIEMSGISGGARFAEKAASGLNGISGGVRFAEKTGYGISQGAPFAEKTGSVLNGICISRNSFIRRCP